MLIAFDGCEGAGKSTQAALLADELARRGQDVIKIREPGGTILGEQLRGILLNPESKIDVRAEVMMFMASRAQMHVEKITPALAAGKTVILDRWAWSTFAYQHGLTLTEFSRITRYATDVQYPNISFILDIPVGTGLVRLSQKTEQSFGGGKDRFEQRSRQFHEDTRARYQHLVKEHPKICKLIDADRSVASIHNEIMGYL